MPARKKIKKTTTAIGTKLYENDFKYVMDLHHQTLKNKSDIVAELVREAIKYRREKSTNLLDPSLDEALTPFSSRVIKKLDSIFNLAEDLKVLGNETANRIQSIDGTLAELLKTSEKSLQSIIILRWVNLFFHIVLYSAAHPTFKNLTQKEWTQFATEIYRQSIILKAAELNAQSFEEIETDIIQKRVSIFLQELKPKAG